MSRINAIRSMLNELDADAFYVSYIPNIRYLTGFSGSTAQVLITKNKKYFVTDFRYKSQAFEEVKDFEIRINYQSADEIKNIFKSDKIKSAVYESTHLIINRFEKLKETLPDVNFIPAAGKLELLTMSKSASEIQLLKKAVEITDMVFDKLLSVIKPGMKEKDVSAEISYWNKKYGADKDSFDPIVASGFRGALPHGVASDKIIENGEMVTLDFGCIYNGFCSDLTRTISVGKPGTEMKKIYQIVLDSYFAAVDLCRSGAMTKDIDSAARNHISSFGYGDNFGHGLGHGLGIEVHEMPSLNQRVNYKLEEGTIITIEPGIYVDGLGGVRIEDDVLIKNGSCEVLNKAPKELIVI